MKTLSLKDVHETLGARFAQVLDWTVPADYGDPKEEHRAVRESAGLFDLSFRGCVRVTGEDRAKYLQGLVTNDVTGLQEGKGCYAAVLNPKGRMLFDLRLYARQDFFIMDLDREVTDKALQILSRYLLRTKAKLEDITDRTVHLGVYGPESAKILQGGLGGPLPAGPEFSNSVIELSGQAVHVIRTAFTGETGYDLLISSDQGATVFKRLMEAGELLGLKPAGVRALESLRVEAGVPRYGIDMDENTFPPEAGLEQKAISYTKGCYVGQETIARIKTYGQVHRILMGYLIEGDSGGSPGRAALPGHQDKVYKDGEEVGNITSAVYSPTLDQNIAMGYIRRKAVEPDLGVTIVTATSGGKIGARVVPLPFYTAKGS